jgi:predicted transcriptional regulator
MEIVYRLGEVTVNDVLDNLDDPPSYSAMRACLRTLEEKGHLAHRQDGPRYVYIPTVPLKQVRKSALQGLLRNFLDDSDSPPSPEELETLARMIEEARKEGR